MRSPAPLAFFAALLIVAITTPATALTQDELPADALYGEIQWNEYESFRDIHADLDTAWELLLAALAPITEDGAVERPEGGWLNVGDVWALAESLPYRDDVWSRVRVRVGSMVTTDQWARAEAVLNSVAALLDERLAYEEWLASGEAAGDLYGDTYYQEYYDSGYGLAGLALPLVAWFGGGGGHSGGCYCYECTHDPWDDGDGGSGPGPDKEDDGDGVPDGGGDPDRDPDRGGDPDPGPSDRFRRTPKDAGTVVHVSDLARRLNDARHRREAGDRAGDVVPGPGSVRPAPTAGLTPISTRIVRPTRSTPTFGRTSIPTGTAGRTRTSSYQPVGRSRIGTLIGRTSGRSVGRSARPSSSGRTSAGRSSGRSTGRSSSRSAGRSSGRGSSGRSSGGRSGGGRGR